MIAVILRRLSSLAAAGQQMLKQGNRKIVNIASLLSFQRILVPLRCSQSACPAHEAFSNEWRRTINVNALRCTCTEHAALRTTRSQPQILERFPQALGDPETLQCGVSLSPASDYVTVILVVDGGWLAR